MSIDPVREFIIPKVVSQPLIYAMNGKIYSQRILRLKI